MASEGLIEQLGPYRLLRRLGRGGMAEVFLAVGYGASGFEKHVAVKRLLPELAGTGELEHLLISEARLGARLRHRNLVQVLGLGIDAGVYYVVLEWIDGTDVETLARHRPLSPALALLIAEEVALALDYLHRARDDAGRPLGLVHRDVSPSNVLISREGEVKLGDLGVAKATLLADVTRGNLRKGKYAYMSPEQVNGEALTAASDQFGLGVMLYELVCGRRPFDGDTVLATMENIRRAEPDLDAVPADVRGVLARCLAARPEARYPSAEALRSAIAAVRRDLPAAALPDLAAWVRQAPRGGSTISGG